jgi:hypothetical protein
MLKLHGDPEVIDSKKMSLMLQWFYPEIPTHVPIQAVADAMVKFIVPPDDNPADPTRRKPKRENAKAPSYCFEFDAEEIFVSFLQEYRINLVSTTYLHWYEFLMLFGNLGKETAMMRKIELRTMDLSQFKGKDKAKLSKAQKAVQIPVKLSQEETSMIEELMRKLGV